MGAYLVLFFLAVAAAPHRHLNDLEDLLLDQRSDSGILAQSVGPEGTPGTAGFHSVRFIEDVPCPACFTGDFVCAPAASSPFVLTLTPLPLPPGLPDIATPELLSAEASSRAPPRVS